MAVRALEKVAGADEVHTRTLFWQGLTDDSSDTGAPADLMDHADRSVQLIGTLGVAGECTVEGSNDGGTTYATLNDPQGDPLVLTALGIYQVQELSKLIRPRISAGDGTTDLDLYLHSRSNR